MVRTRRRDRAVPASRPPTAYWPYVLLATFAVAVLPVLVVSMVQATGILRSTVASVAVAVALSVGASVTGSALWTRRRGSRDVVFADLMIWGWVRRLRTESRLADTNTLLGDRAKLSPSRQARLLERLSAALEARDPYTHGHSRRVTRYSEAIARAMGLSRAQVAKVRTAAAVHDVGKVKTPREVLNKPGRLTDEEFAAIKLHPVDGAELVTGMGDPELTAMVRHHHERLDGCGYPDGLRAEEIPLGARIIAVADTFDAITSTRPYRAGGKHKTALDILRKEAGSQLDPAAVDAFLNYYSGRRSVAFWSLLVTEPPRFVSWLLGWVQGAGATPIVKGLVAAGATAFMGTTVVSPPAPTANVRTSPPAAAVAQRADDRGGSEAAPAAGTRRQSEPRSPRSGDRARRDRVQPPARRRSRVPARPPKRSYAPGSRSAPDGDSGSPAGSGGGGSGSGESAGGSSGGGGSGGGGSGGGPDSGSLPTIELPKSPVPAPVPVPKLPPPPQPPPAPDPAPLPQIEPPPVPAPPVTLPSLEGG